MKLLDSLFYGCSEQAQKIKIHAIWHGFSFAIRSPSARSRVIASPCHTLFHQLFTLLFKIATLGLLALINTVTAVPLAKKEPGHTITEYAVIPAGQNPDPASLNWTTTEPTDLSASSHVLPCHVDDCAPAGPPCRVKRDTSYNNLSQGRNWTPWCRVPGLHTQNKGSFGFVSTGHSESVTWSSGVDLEAGPLGDWLSANIGVEVTKSKSVGKGVGCVNTDGKKHSVWAREQVSWSEVDVHTTITYTGGDCPDDYDGWKHVRADFPDPDNSGFRSFQAGCGSPDNDKNPVCNFDAQHL